MTTILSHSIYYASTQTIFYNDLINTPTTTGNISRNRELVLFDLLDVTSETVFRFPPLGSSHMQDAREGGLFDVAAAGRARNLYQLIVDVTLHIIKKENLIEIQEGNIPFVLSIPHGGERKNIPHSFIIQRHLHYFSPAASVSAPEGASPSEEGEYTLIPMFANEPDSKTLELGAVLERHLIQLLNSKKDIDTESDSDQENPKKLPLLRPYIVRANLHRQYCDLNRPPGRMSYDSLQGQVTHRYYHQQGLKTCCDKVSKIYDSAFFMDLHGHPVDREEGDTVTFFRGTRNGLAWQKFLSREEERKRGAASLTGPWSVMGYLARLPPPTEISSISSTSSSSTSSSTSVSKTRYGVEPNITIESEARRVASIGVEQTMQGGFIVQTCGEDRNDTMQAIQLETGIDHRRTVEQQEQTGKDIAEAVNVFLKTYLSEEMAVAENKRRRQ